MQRIYNSEFEIEPVTCLPLSSMEEMIMEIVELNPNALITDFMLNDIKQDVKYNIPYNGVELVNEFCVIKKGFPCFIMTSHENQAISQSEDVNIVYVKKLFNNEDPENTSFIGKVVEQIKHYHKHLETAQSRISELISKRNQEPLTCKEEEELIMLDSLIEGSIDNRSSIPNEIKKMSNSQKISDLITRADILISKFEQLNEKLSK